MAVTFLGSGRDERGEYTRYRAGKKEYTVRALVRYNGEVMPFDDYLAKAGLSRTEWYRRHEEKALSEVYGCPIEVHLA